MAIATNNPYGNYTPGQAPGQNQVNLPAMQGNLANLLNSGDLGNNTANPMSGIIADEGQSQLGYQNAMANSRMAQTGLQSEQAALQNAEQAWQTQQQQPGLMDWLALATGASNYGKFAGQKTPQQAQATPGTYDPSTMSDDDWNDAMNSIVSSNA